MTPPRPNGDPDCVDVVLLGVGAVGRELLSQIATARTAASARLRIRGLVDRTGYVFNPRGLSRREIREIRTWKQNGASLCTRPNGSKARPAKSLRAILDSSARPGVLVDVTAADTHEMLESALNDGWSVVLANKAPIAATQSRADQLESAARRGGGSIRHEATVGAGLPVIETLNSLLASGDRVLGIDACPSGTLGFIFRRVADGNSFSCAVREAMEAGYTEPDPRADLSGLDVARKALILARMLGFRGDIHADSVESLVPARFRDMPVDRFFAELPTLDDHWRRRVAAAGSRGAALEYRARVTPRRIGVGLVEVSRSDQLGALRGPDNHFAFRTARYQTRPLVIAGPGAGAAVTAAGVHSDILRVAASNQADARGMAVYTRPMNARNSAM
jgi:aspartokinase/homoserine dehydrogenase 1